VEPEIIRAIDAAKSSVHLALYEFKLPGILEALRRARDRGVEIHIVLDYSNVYPQQEPGSTYRPRRSQEIWALLREGFDVKILRGLSKYGINHNKIAVIDHGEKETMAFFGSYNWSWSAEEHHYENANFTTEKRRTEALMAYWKWLDSLAQPESAARDYAWPSSVPAPPVTVAEDIHFNGISLPSVVLSPSRLAGKTVEDRLVQAIDAAETSIDMSAFAVRSTKIAEALVRAHKDPKRKVKVRVIFDESQAESEPFGLYAKYLAANGVEVRGLAGPNPNSDFPLAEKDHHKFTVFDGKLVETGSANMTKYASAANFENAHFLDNKTDVAGYAWVFDRMFKRAAPVEAPQVAPTLPTDAELEAEVTQAPPPAPQPEPHPGPADPSITPRDIPFNGKVFPSYAFRPDTPIQPIVVQALDAAKTSIRMAVYEFNLPDVLDALRRAKKRKLKIELVIDQSHVYTRGKDHTNQPRKPSAEILALINEGFDVLVLKGEKSGIMHNKYMVLDAEDGGMVEFGSYNFAKTAENNHYENIKFSNDAADVKDYLAYFNYKRGLASPIDHDKLDEVLNRGLAGDDDGEAAPEARGSGDPRDSKFPHPPVSTAPSITFNGETFHRHYFSPQGGILDAWVRAIRAAESSIDIAMFGFYSKEVAEAVIERMERAKQEGKELTVRLLLDAGQSSLAKIDGTPVGQWFAQRGAEVHMKAGPNPEGDPMFEKQHNKFMIIDGKLLFTGSFNLSPTAENNSFENENVVDDPADLRGYVEYFMRVFGLGWPPRGSKTAAGAASAAPHSFLGF
jgi:phosphatidylserine/phosphatidylglycerophosphate/cardiolipin synthase-like enzyme